MNSNTMTNKTAIITGGARGLGRTLSLAFHSAGYNVAATFFSSEENAGKLSGLSEGRFMTVRTDVGKTDEMQAMAEEVSRRWKVADVLVNNAGVSCDSLLLKQSEEDWEKTMTINLKGVFNAIRAFVPLMKHGGHIINISSYSGLKGKTGQAAYSASKAALLGLSRSAAIELAPAGIRVNAILPGYMATDMGKASAGALSGAREESLLKTLSDPEEVSDFVLYLSGTSNITGQIFSLDSRII
jgi:3-oxoacyl-[acyl-carrier protein] reductase